MFKEKGFKDAGGKSTGPSDKLDVINDELK